MLVDQAVSRFRGEAIDVVIAIGGGSVLDAAKAIAGLLPHGNSVMDHLEGVGKNVPYHGPSTPFIAVPTTAGTGSEATKNSVLSVQGPDGFKKSFRDECLIPEYAVIDPDLLASCPRELVAADGMDAFTQLLESYVSLQSQPVYRRAGLERHDRGEGRFFCRLGRQRTGRQPGPRRDGLRGLALRHHLGASRPGLGTRLGLAAGRLLSDPARRGLRHVGIRRDRGQYQGDAAARTGKSGFGQICASRAVTDRPD